MTKKFIIVISALLCLLFFQFCKAKKGAQTLVIDNNFVIPHTHNVHVDSGFVKDGILNLKISYSGGCKKHYFTLTTNGKFTTTNPAQVFFHLEDTVRNDNCRQFIEENILFNINKLKHSTHKNIELIFADMYKIKYQIK